MWKSVSFAIAVLACGLTSAGHAQSPLAVPAPVDTLAGTDSPSPADSAAAADSLAPPVAEKHFARAAFEVTTVNALVWAYCRYIREGGTNTGFRISLDSWNENLSNGFDWDDNNFATNQLAHPYHGSTYFCAARANGYDYYESIAFAFAGSAMWEYFGEVHHPSINDWISTSVGGIALGEALHRFSGMIVDQRAEGSERVWREIGGFLVNPVGGFDRLITGKMSRKGANPPDWRRHRFVSAIRAGARFTRDGTVEDADTLRAFARLRGVVGDPTGSVVRKPYDAFSIDVQLNADEITPVGRGQVFGLLRSWEVDRSERRNSYFAITNSWDYINNSAYELGAQSFGAGYLTRVKSDSWTLNAGLTANWIVLGGTSSDYESYTGRSYDYGPGAGGRFFASLRHRWLFLGLESDLYYLRVMNGTDADHIVTENRLTAAVPVSGAFNLGTELSVYHARRHYADFDDVSERDPQLTAYVAWNP